MLTFEGSTCLGPLLPPIDLQCGLGGGGLEDKRGAWPDCHLAELMRGRDILPRKHMQSESSYDYSDTNLSSPFTRNSNTGAEAGGAGPMYGSAFCMSRMSSLWLAGSANNWFGCSCFQRLVSFSVNFGFAPVGVELVCKRWWMDLTAGRRQN